MYVFVCVCVCITGGSILVLQYNMEAKRVLCYKCVGIGVGVGVSV